MSLAYEEVSELSGVGQAFRLPDLPEEVGFAPQRVVEMAAEARLAGSPYHELRRVSCRFAEGILTLIGHVSTYYLKQIAQHTVGQIEGVAGIDNRLSVVSPAVRSAR